MTASVYSSTRRSVGVGIDGVLNLSGHGAVPRTTVDAGAAGRGRLTTEGFEITRDDTVSGSLLELTLLDRA